MFKTGYLHEIHKEKYECSNVFEDSDDAEPETSVCGSAMVPGWESLQDLNCRFARYINRARVFEQRNAVFRKQLETLQHMEEAAGFEETFSEQIATNQQRFRELLAERTKLERQLKDAERMLDEFSARYSDEFEYQEQLRGTLEQLNKEADAALLRNLQYQIESQFLQDDINSTRERHKKNLAEIQTYVNILHQINETVVLMPSMPVGISEDPERMLAQKKVPVLHSHLEEYKTALCQLEAQKHKLQRETSTLEQTIKCTQERYDDEIQLYNEQIESLRKRIEEAELLLEKYTNDCRQLAIYQTSLENELERYKRIIENEDDRLNSAIIGTPISLFTTDYRPLIQSSTNISRGIGINQAIQDITNVKPRQKNLAKKVTKKRELTHKDFTDSKQEQKCEGEKEERKKELEETAGKKTGKQSPQIKTGARNDVPDGAQISKAFDTLCNIVRNRMRRYRKPEPVADFFTKGSYVLVTGESSYLDPCFYTSTPSAGHVLVTICDNRLIPYGPFDRKSPSPPPIPPKPSPSGVDDSDETSDSNNKERQGGRTKGKDPGSIPMPKKSDKGKGTKYASWHHGPPSLTMLTSDILPDSMSYEKVEVVESVERLSPDSRLKGYEETSVVVETTIEKTSKKKAEKRTT